MRDPNRFTQLSLEEKAREEEEDVLSELDRAIASHSLVSDSSITFNFSWFIH